MGYDWRSHGRRRSDHRASHVGGSGQCRDVRRRPCYSWRSCRHRARWRWGWRRRNLHQARVERKRSDRVRHFRQPIDKAVDEGRPKRDRQDAAGDHPCTTGVEQSHEAQPHDASDATAGHAGPQSGNDPLHPGGPAAWPGRPARWAPRRLPRPTRCHRRAAAVSRHAQLH